MLDFQSQKPDLSFFYQSSPANSLKSSINTFSPISSIYSYQQQFANSYYNYSQNQMFSNSIMGLEQQMSCILETNGKNGGLYLGNINCAMNPNLLKQYGIKAVLTVLKGSGLRYKNNIEHFILPIGQKMIFLGQISLNTSIKEQSLLMIIQKDATFWCIAMQAYVKYFFNTDNFFQQLARSSTLVIAYLMRYCGMNLNQAYSLVKLQRNQICPNPGFLQQLKKYEFYLFQAFAQRNRSEKSLGSQIKSFWNF